MKKFTKGIHIFEYEDIYVMTQTLTNEEFGEMMEDAMSLLTGMLSPGATGDSIEVTVEGTEVTETVKTTEETTVKVEATEVEAVEEEVTEETAEVVIEEELEDIFTDLAINIEEYYVVTTIDKKTLFPIKTSGTTHTDNGC